MDDKAFVKKAFLDHLRRREFTEQHLEVYGEYFDFFLEHLGAAQIMELDPESIYQAALTSLSDLDGDDVIEAYLQMMEFFTEYWSERWESLHPEEDSGSKSNPPAG